jgi:hypothetical protein
MQDPCRHGRARRWQSNCSFQTSEVTNMSCAHKNCRCDEATIEEGGKHYCSERCADDDANGERASGCTCGHPDCAAV